MKYLVLIFLFSCSSSQKLYKAELLPGHTQNQHESFSNNIMIATQGIHSTLAGNEIVRAGGNVFDVAAAVSFIIAVERPQSTGIGGGGFMLIDGPDFRSPTTLDFREMAPGKAHEKMYLDENGDEIKGLSLNGPLSSGVPGMVHGVLTMHEKYGKLPRHLVIKPAIKLAEEGFEVYPHLADAIERRLEIINQYPASKEIFTKDGLPLKVGDILIQKDLAKTLRSISEHGKDGFYKGWVADAIAKEMKASGGLITKKDLKQYKTVERKPVKGSFKGYDIYSMGPPSSGGTHVIQILNILEGFDLNKIGIQNDKTIHTVASAMQLAFVDRARYMGDSDFVKVPLDKLTSKKYATQLRNLIGRKALRVESNIPKPAKESNDTTHFTVMDIKGNIVTSTQTINYLLGSGHVIPGTGIVMNDEMDDFSTKPGAMNVFGAVGSEANKVEAKKRPLSSMSPTIVKKDGKTILGLGTPSGTRILTCVTQVILNYLEFKQPLYDAVSATRYHHQWKPETLRVGPPYFPSMTLKNLEEAGHKIDKKPLGCKVQAIALEQNKLHGVSDPRGEGLAKGLSLIEKRKDK